MYPTPRAGAAVLPAEGARWPLARTAAGGYTITRPDTGRTLEFGPPAAGTAMLSSISDRNGHRIDFGYDASGTEETVRHSGGYEIAVTTANGRVVALRLRNEAAADIPLVRFEYDEALRLSAVINSSGLAMRFRYRGRADQMGGHGRRGAASRPAHGQR